jgi:RIMS-binding protein 2
MSQDNFHTQVFNRERMTTVHFMFSDLVPAPRHLTLERQLNKSVLIGWNPPDQYGHHQIESYHVYVDGNLKVTVKAAERTRALVEGVDCNRVCLCLN